MRACPSCGAKGTVLKSCSRCNGTGVEKANGRTTWGFEVNGRIVDSRTCIVCKGTGKEPFPCNVCLGSGYVDDSFYGKFKRFESNGCLSMIYISALLVAALVIAF